MAEWSKATDCKSVKSSVRIRPCAPGVFMLSKSPKRNTFQKERYKARLEEEGKDMNSKSIVEMLGIFDQIDEETTEREASEEFKINNLEYDLRSTHWILEKTRTSEAYAQNLYAALCNNEFVKGDNEPWGCSWRYAGGIIADMRQEGDYIDWYCSGIRDVFYEEEENQKWDLRKYVPEGTITDEIFEDLYKLNWVKKDE